MEAVPVQTGRGRRGARAAQGVPPQGLPQARREARREARRASPSTASRSRWRRARPSPSSARTARGSRRSSACSRRSCSRTAGRPGSSATTSSRTSGPCAGSSTASRSRRRSSRRCRRRRTSSYASRFYGMTLDGDARQDPRDPRARRVPARPADEPMENLSRGMQQKVALARALLTSPVVLLLDEPTTGLDPRSKLEVQEFIREIRETHDSTILLCTHDLAEAETLAERIGILDRGQAARARAGGRPQAPLRRRDARGGVLRRDRPGVRGGRRRRRRRSGGVRMKAMWGTTASRARRSRRRRRAQRLPHQALHLVGPRLVLLDRREHADDRLHRQGHRVERRSRSTSTST